MKNKIYIILTFLMVCFSLCACSEEKQSEYFLEINSSDIYEFIDKETGVHYWIYSHSGYNCGMGGMTPRLKSDGSVMVDKVAE